MTLRERMIERLAWELSIDTDEGCGSPFDNLMTREWRRVATAAFDAMTPPLEWELASDDVWNANGYTITFEFDYELWEHFDTSDSISSWPTPAAAQAAAEDHYLRQRYRGTKLMEGME